MSPPKHPTADDEASLVATAQQGGPDGAQAFDALARAHSDDTVRYLRYLMGDSDRADDVAQDTLLRAYAGIARLKKGASFRSWLRKIATRLAYNASRDRGTRRVREEQSASEGYAVAPSAESEVASRETVKVVLDRMSYPYREIVLLRYVEELEVTEIADVLDIGKSAAKMRLSRARAEFGQIYKEVTGHDVP